MSWAAAPPSGIPWVLPATDWSGPWPGYWKPRTPAGGWPMPAAAADRGLPPASKGKCDGFVKSPISSLRCIPSEFHVLYVRCIPRDLRRLDLELFTLPSQTDFLRKYQILGVRNKVLSSGFQSLISDLYFLVSSF